MPFFYSSVKKIYCRLLLLYTFCCCMLFAIAQPVVSFNSVINNSTPGGALANPVDIVNAGDNSQRLFVVQQGGVIRVYDQTPTFIGNFLTVTGLGTGGERGLLSMAFHPDYENNGYFFVYYTNTNGDIELARYHTPAATPNAADPASKQVVLTIPHPGETNHNGGKLNFGSDGYLYFATGDGGGGGDVPNNAQTGSSLLGKMLRINVSGSATGPLYTIPPDNPFLATAPDDNIRDEIWAIGLRNPFRWSFDRQTQDMWIADVGQNLWEEVNFLPAGSDRGVNYGWHCFEGTHTFNGGTGCPINGPVITPILDYPHNNATGGVAVIGGYVYRGTLNPAIAGHYIFADESSGNVWLLPPGGAAADTIQFKNILTLISSFGEAENGELYVTNLNGQVYRVLATVGGALPVKLISFSGTAKPGQNELSWQTTNEVQFRQYEVEYSSDGVQFEQAGVVAAAGASNYHYSHIIASNKKLYYRLKMVDLDGKSEYSKTIVVNTSSLSSRLFVTPSVVNNNLIQVALNDAYNNLQVINMDGKTVYRESVVNRTGKITVSLPSLRPGQYLVSLLGNGKQLTQKIMIQ